MISTLITPDRLTVIRSLANMVSDVAGNALEVGVYMGGSLSVIAKALPHKRIYGFDTFKGLPSEKHSTTEVFKPGEFHSGSLDRVKLDLLQDQVFNFKLVEGLFPESVDEMDWKNYDGHNKGICFAHLDVDYEKSMRDCLSWVGPRLSQGGIIVVDDYDHHRCPGVKPAVDDFVKEYGYEHYSPVPGQCWMRRSYNRPELV